MFDNKSLKLKFTNNMVRLFLLITIITSFAAVLKSSKIIPNGTKDAFLLNVKNSMSNKNNLQLVF